MDIWQKLLIVDLFATLIIGAIMYQWGYGNGREDERKKHQ